jgi:hypothetical protein
MIRADVQTFVALTTALLLTQLVAMIAAAAEPELRFVFPPGGQVGQRVEVELIGTQAESIDQLYIPALNVTATRTGKAKANLSIPINAAQGEYDAWGVSQQVLCAPCRIVVGSVLESIENEPNSAAMEPQAVELPLVINGRLDPGTDIDWYKVRLNAGVGLTMNCRSVTLGGTAWPTLTVLDPQGREIAHDAMTNLEPTLHFQPPTDGEYRIGVQDRSYRSTPAPFYRLTLTTGPWMTGAFPPTLVRGKSQPVTLYGYHLPGGTPVEGTQDSLVQVEAAIQTHQQGTATGGMWTPSRAMHVESFVYRHPGSLGQVRFALMDRVSHISLSAEMWEPNRVTPPIDVAGQFASFRHTVDRYQFAAKSGQTFWLEAFSERVDRKCDLELALFDAQGKLLESLSNIVIPKGQPTIVPWGSRDPAGAWKTPSDGDYVVAVRDLLAAASIPGERAYCVSISPQREDVRVIAALGDGTKAQGWAVTPGKSITVSLVAVRRGGHSGPITIRAADLPPGLEIVPATISANENAGKLIIQATNDAAPWIGTVKLTATTEIDRQTQTFEVQVAMPTSVGTPPTARLCEPAVIAILGPSKS